MKKLLLSLLIAAVAAGIAWYAISWCSTDARLVRAIQRDDLSEVRRLLLADKYVVTRPLSTGAYAMHYAAGGRKGHNVLSLLLDLGVDSDSRDSSGSTPLMWAVTFRNPEAARMLLAKGADANARSLGGYTALHRASWLGYDDMVQALISGGASPNAAEESRKHFTALHYAARLDRCAVASVLLKNGADMSSRDRDGNTPLHIAVEKGRYDVARILLEAGAGIDEKNHAGTSARMIADAKKDDRMVGLLREYEKKQVSSGASKAD